MKNKKSNQISFIVPCYNSKQSLKKCLDSILQQNLNCEIILINDGSIDDTHGICETYFKAYSNIKYIKLEKNMGVSNARNNGMEVVSGKFICFVDSDDYLSEDFGQKIKGILNANHSLIIFGKIYDHNGKLTISNLPLEGDFSKEELILYNTDAFLNVNTSIWVHNKLYRNDIIKKNKITFKKQIHFGEDFYFNLDYFNYVKNVYYLKEHISFYNRNNESSLSRTYESKNLSEIISQRKYLYSYLKKIDLPNYNIFYQDTKNIIIYAIKKVLGSKKSSLKNKQKELSLLKLLFFDLTKFLDKNNQFQLDLYNYITKNDKKIFGDIL